MLRRPWSRIRPHRESMTSSRTDPKSLRYDQRAPLAPSASRSAAVGELPDQRLGVPVEPADPLVQLVLGQFGRGTGCPGADTPSTTTARRRSAPATSSWPACRHARTARCSSRPGRRGRRRSSTSAPSTAASGPRDRSRIRSTARCIPRSRRPAPWIASPGMTKEFVPDRLNGCGLRRFARKDEVASLVRQSNATGKLPKSLSTPSRKNIPLNLSGKSKTTIVAIPCPQEGRFAIGTNVGRGERWTRHGRKTSAHEAYGEVVWS